MKNKEIIKQLNKELNSLPVPNVLKNVQEKSDIVVKENKSVSKKRKFVLPNFLKFGVSIALIIAVSVLALTNILNVDNYTTVTIDINPSIELVLNQQEQVVAVNPINADGQTLLQDLNLKNQTLNQAITKLLNKAAEQGKFNINATDQIENAIMFSVKNKKEDTENQFKNKMQNAISGYLNSRNIPCNVIYEEYSKNLREEFKDFVRNNENAGMSVAKYAYIQEIIENYPELEGQENVLADMGVAELYKLLNGYIDFESVEDLLQDILDGVFDNSNNFNNPNSNNPFNN